MPQIHYKKISKIGTNNIYLNGYEMIFFYNGIDKSLNLNVQSLGFQSRLWLDWMNTKGPTCHFLIEQWITPLAPASQCRNDGRDLAVGPHAHQWIWISPSILS